MSATLIQIAKGFLRNVKTIDQFAIPISLKAFENQKHFKSSIGGISTLLIYSFYLLYLIYVLVLWQSNQIQPSSVRFSEGQNITSHKFQDDTAFSICYWKYMEGILDPFTEQDNILMPLFMYYINGVQQTRVSLLMNTSKSKYNSTLIKINNLNLSLNDVLVSNRTRQEGFIIITDCDQQYLYEGQSCASSDKIEKFKQQVNYVSFQHLFQHLTLMKSKPKKQDLNINFYDFCLATISQRLSQYRITVLERSQVQFYRRLSILLAIGRTGIQCQTTRQTILFGIPTQIVPNYGIIYQFVSVNLNIRYQNIGEILAQVGSIVSLLMMSKTILEQLNTHILDNMVQDQILNQWFPKQIKLNKYGIIQAIAGYQSDEKVKYFKTLADSKLDIIDIIYQIQRIQLILIKKFGRNEIAEANSYIIQPRTSLTDEIAFERENEFYIEDLEILKCQYK